MTLSLLTFNPILTKTILLNRKFIFVFSLCFLFNSSINSQSIVYNSTVNLYGYSYPKKNNTRDTITGTSFIYGFLPKIVDSLYKSSFPYLVSNNHVIENMDICKLIFTKANKDGTPNYGNTWSYESKNFSKLWIRHPDTTVDLAIMPLEAIFYKAKEENVRLYYFNISEFNSPDSTFWKSSLKIENIIMSGYPNGLMDSHNNVPIIRTGTLSTPLKLDYNGRKEILIDVPVFPGSSGSPIFLKHSIFELNGTSLRSGFDYKFIGIAYASFNLKSRSSVKVVNIPTDPSLEVLFDLPLNIALCIKSSELKGFEQIVRTIQKMN